MGSSGVIFNVSARAPLLVSPSRAIQGNPGLLELVESIAVGGIDDTVAIRAANRPATGALPGSIVAEPVPATAMVVRERMARSP